MFQVIIILIILGIVVLYALYLLINAKSRENYLFFSYFFLIFIVIYCVSILKYKIGGSNISIEKITEQASKEAVKKSLVYLADSYIDSATDMRHRDSDLWFQEEMIVKRDRAKDLYLEAGVEKEKIQSQLDSVNELISENLAERIKSDSIHELRKAGHHLTSEQANKFIKEFDTIMNTENKLSVGFAQEIENNLTKYNLLTEQTDQKIKTLKFFTANKYLESQDIQSQTGD